LRQIPARFCNTSPYPNPAVARFRGAGVAGKYLAYRNAMKKFVEACQPNGSGRIDALALDAFFYMRSKLSET